MNIDDMLAEKVAKAIEPLTEQIRRLTEMMQPSEIDETGGVELAMRITGKKKPTIYRLVSQRQIPHSKQGNHLYFSKTALLNWIEDGRRKTAKEIISK